MTTKITSRQLYAGLRDVLGATLRSAGFARTKGGWLGWTRPAGSEHVTFWFQCDKWGWDPAFGSRFTLEFQIGPTVVPAEAWFDKRARFAELLRPDELELVRTLNNGVKASLDEPGADHPIFFIKPQEREILRSQYRPSLDPYRSSDDIWLHYFRPGDVTGWGAFFKPRILRMVADFVHGV